MMICETDRLGLLCKASNGDRHVDHDWCLPAVQQSSTSGSGAAFGLLCFLFPYLLFQGPGWAFIDSLPLPPRSSLENLSCSLSLSLFFFSPALGTRLGYCHCIAGSIVSSQAQCAAVCPDARLGQLLSFRRGLPPCLLIESIFRSPLLPVILFRFCRFLSAAVSLLRFLSSAFWLSFAPLHASLAALLAAARSAAAASSLALYVLCSFDHLKPCSVFSELPASFQQVSLSFPVSVLFSVSGFCSSLLCRLCLRCALLFFLQELPAYQPSLLLPPAYAASSSAIRFSSIDLETTGLPSGGFGLPSTSFGNDRLACRRLCSNCPCTAGFEAVFAQSSSFPAA